MAFITKTLILLCLIGLLVQSSQQSADDGTWDSQYPGSYYRVGYKDVNSYLVGTVDSSAPMNANVEALEARLKSDEATEREKRVMRKLVGLKTLEGRCDQISYEALQDNDEATESKSHDVTSKKSAPRRIDKVVNYYGKQHAITCQKRTMSLFKPKIKQLGKQVMNSLSAWLDPIIERLLANFQPPKGVQIADDDESSKIFYGLIKNDLKGSEAITDVELAYNAIKALVKDNPEDERRLHYYSDEESGVREFNMRGLYDKYIKGPCTTYRREMEDLFNRADYDAYFHHDVDPSEPLFYRGWAYRKICFRAFYDYWPYSELQDHAKAIADREEEEDE